MGNCISPSNILWCNCTETNNQYWIFRTLEVAFLTLSTSWSSCSKSNKENSCLASASFWSCSFWACSFFCLEDFLEDINDVGRNLCEGFVVGTSGLAHTVPLAPVVLSSSCNWSPRWLDITLKRLPFTEASCCDLDLSFTVFEDFDLVLLVLDLLLGLLLMVSFDDVVVLLLRVVDNAVLICVAIGCSWEWVKKMKKIET